MSKITWTLLSALALSFSVNADETNVSNVTAEVSKTTETKASDEADQLITNRRLRASQGSLSDWSINSSWNYNGGSLEKPIGSSRPNVTGASDVPAVQNLSGNIGVSYRASTYDRFTLGFGLQMASPFSSKADESFTAAGKREFEETQGDVDLNNPSLSYSRVMNIAGVQTVLGTSMTYYTQDALTNIGYNTYNDITLNTMYEFKGTGFSAGMLFSAGAYSHSKEDPSLASSQAEYVFYAMPQAEYVINDTFNLRTILRPYWYQNSRGQSFSKWTRLDMTQSVGLGISMTRNIFLYPNIQFAPDNIRADRTNIGLSANINIF